MPNRPQIDTKNASPKICARCSCTTFLTAFTLLEVSAFDKKNPTGMPVVVPSPTLICSDCSLEVGAPVPLDS